MYQRYEIATNSDPMVKAIAKRLGYRRKTVSIVVTESVTLTDLNWSGGTRSQYTAVDLSSMQTVERDLSHAPPWENRFEGLSVPLPNNAAIVRHGTFCGRVSQMTFYIRPSTLNLLIGAPQ